MYHNAWSRINLNLLISFVPGITELKNICLNCALCQVRLFFFFFCVCECVCAGSVDAFHSVKRYISVVFFFFL